MANHLNRQLDSPNPNQRRQMASEGADRAMGAIIGVAVADAAGRVT